MIRKSTSYVLFAFLFLTQVSKAQLSSALFYTESGHRMYVLLNGIIQNQAPQTYLRIDQLSPQTYRCRILFEDSRMGHVDRLISLQPTSENRFLVGPGVMNAFDIFSMGAVPYGPSFQAQSIPNQQVIVYHQSPLPMQQITTTTVTEDDWGPDFMDVSFSSNGLNMNITTNDPFMAIPPGTVTQQTTNMQGGLTTTTTTTTTYSNGFSTQPVMPQPPVVIVQQAPPVPVQTMPQALPGYTGPIGCNTPVSPSELEAMKGSIQSKSFEQSKLVIAKQILQARCLFASQVRELMLLFSFEQSRLDIAKFAYAYTYDRGNYFKVNDAFQFEHSISQLNDFISRGR